MTHRKLFVTMAALVILALMLTVSSVTTAQTPSAPGSTLPYSGRLVGPAGQPVIDGRYDFVFSLYIGEKENQALWTETQFGVWVKGGDITTLLGSSAALPLSLPDQSTYWLEVSVRGPGELGFTMLTPRQALNTAPGAPSSVNVLTCPHSHFTDTWAGSSAVAGLIVDNKLGTGDGIRAYSSSTEYNFGAIFAANEAASGSGSAIYARSNYGSGVFSEALGAASAVVGKANASTGNSRGVWGESASNSGIGVVGKSTSTTGNTTGVWGEIASSSQYARAVVGWATKATGLNYGMWGQSESDNGTGVYGQANNAACTKFPLSSNICSGVNGVSTNGAGVYGSTNAGAGVMALSVNGVGVKVYTTAGNLIEGWTGPGIETLKFKVTAAGNVTAAGTIAGGGADMAEMLPAAAGLEPGDVLVVGLDGHLARSTQPNQANVVGVYSTQPGFVGGAGEGVDLFDKVPLAVVGIVPVKVSAENGAIQPGDLLVAASLPGHAMRAPANPAPGTVIGKALSPLASGSGTLQMLVMLR